MAILQALIAFVTRSFGRILSALFDWAVVAIFGYVTGTQKIFLSGLLAAAGAWPLLLLGIIAPRFGTFVLAFVPIPTWVPSSVVRGVWIGISLVIPLAVGDEPGTASRSSASPRTSRGGPGPRGAGEAAPSRSACRPRCSSRWSRCRCCGSFRPRDAARTFRSRW